MEQYLASSSFFNYEHPTVKSWLNQVCPEPGDPIEIACRLYAIVRDGFPYDPYTFRGRPESFTASHMLEVGRGYCITKAVLLGAAARARGIPSRLCLFDVVNHLADPAFVHKLGSHVFVMHACIELFLSGRWVKATPAFDKRLCERFGVAPLDFDGRSDSMFQEFNGDQRYMEYCADHGHFADVPVEFIVASMGKAYPQLKSAIECGEWISRD